jgi:hypothetical protein
MVRRALVLALWPLVGCFEPAERDGAVACSGDGDCPPGFTCHDPDWRCYREPPSPSFDGLPIDAPIDADVDADPVPDGDPSLAHLRIVVNGRGRVVVEPLGVSCDGTNTTPGDCQFSAAPNTEVNLLPVQLHPASPFRGWTTTNCSAFEGACTLTLPQTTTLVGARFGN